jgi:hypothetical protein
LKWRRRNNWSAIQNIDIHKIISWNNRSANHIWNIP